MQIWSKHNTHICDLFKQSNGLKSQGKPSDWDSLAFLGFLYLTKRKKRISLSFAYWWVHQDSWSSAWLIWKMETQKGQMCLFLAWKRDAYAGDSQWCRSPRSINIYLIRAWRDDSASKSTHCSCEGSKFECPHTLSGGAQLVVPPTPGRISGPLIISMSNYLYMTTPHVRAEGRQSR